jgi:hypothetical protein
MPDKRRVAGTVDRIEGEVVVIIFKEPDSGDTREVYVDKKKFTRVELKEGDPVTVQLSVSEAEPIVMDNPIPRKLPSTRRLKKR